MNIRNTITILSLSILASCTRKKTITMVEPPKEIITNVVTDIDGVLNSNMYAKNERVTMTVVKKESEDYPALEVSIPIKIVFTSPAAIRAGRGYNDYGPTLELEFLDKNDRKIDNAFARMDINYTDLARFLQSGNREEWIKFTATYSIDKYGEVDNNLAKSKKFFDELSMASKIRIKSQVIEEKSGSSTASSSSHSSSGSIDSDCEQFLNKYEEVVLEYARITKQMASNPNDQSYMTQLAALTAKISDIKGSLESCKNDAKVAARLMELEMKMVQAMQ